MFKKVYIEITNICNLKCNFCPETNRKKQYMKITDFEEIIQKVCKHTNLVCLHVKGEPFLHNQLKDILYILEKYKLKANITTNGTLIKEKLELLKNSNSLRQINFSIHSITKNKELESQYLQDIFQAVEQLPNIMISYRLWNIQDIKENNINNKIINQIEEYYKIKNLNQKLKKSKFLKLKNNIFINQDIEFVWPNIKGKKIIENGRCLAIKDQIAILVDGTVVPCCLDNNGEIKLGNIFQETLEEILDKLITQDIRKNFENSVIKCNICKTCGFLKNLEDKRK